MFGCYWRKRRTGRHLPTAGVGNGPQEANYFETTSAGGCQLPSPAGRIEGGAVFGQ